MTEEIMEQYETVRQSSACNMFDYYCVIQIANKLDMDDLANVSRDEYKDILKNFNKYMKKFKIDQTIKRF